MNFKYEKGRKILLGVGMVILLLTGVERSDAQQYYDAFSKMLSVTSTLRTNFYNDIISTNAARGSFKELAGASRITPQEIANLCKPFPCGNESNLNTSSQPTTLSGVSASSRPATAPRQYPITATDFSHVGRRILPDEIARTAQGTTEEKEALRTLCNQYIDLLEKEGRPNNVANSLAFLIEASLQIAAGKELSDPEEELLISGFNNSLANTPQFVSMASRDKQILYESAIISAGMIHFLYTQGKEQNDPKMQADSKQMARAVIAHFFGVQIS